MTPLRTLPVGWTQATLADCVSLVSGVGFPENLQGVSDAPVPVYKVGDISRLVQSGRHLLQDAAHSVSYEVARGMASVLVPPNATVFAKIGAAIALNRRAVTTKPCLVDNNVMAAIPHETCLAPLFLFNFMRTVRLEECSRATTVPSIRRGDVESIELSLPPLPEQVRIVEALDSHLTRLDAATEGLKRIEANLKRYRASVLKAAVEGRLVPTQAELAKKEGRSYEHASSLLARIAKERRRRWEETEFAKMQAKGAPITNDNWKSKYEPPAALNTSELPTLPSGWCWTTWGQIGFSQNGKAFPSSAYQAEGVPLLRPGNLHQSGRVEWNSKNTRCLPEGFATEAQSHIVRGGELVMNLTAQSLRDEFLGRVCLTGTNNFCLLNQRVARLTPVILDARFVLWVLKSPWFRRFVDGLNKGSLIQHMFTSQLDSFAFPLPPLEEQHRIVLGIEEALSVEDQVIGTVEKTEARMGRLRGSILKWAFDGKLVDQNPNDEPARIQVDHIREDRTKAVTKAKKLARGSSRRIA